MRFVSRLLYVSLLSVLVACTGNSQQVTGIIRGTIFDPSGAVVASVPVTVIQAETGFVRTASSDSQGDFTFVELPIGHYRVEASAPGFSRFEQDRFVLGVNQTITVAVRLKLAQAGDIDLVTDAAPLVDTTSSNLGKTVDAREIQNLPLNGRHFTQLGTLLPGVAPMTPGLSAAGGSLRDGQAYAVNGQRPESNNFLIDGADNFNNVDGGFVMEPPVDAIAEFRILAPPPTSSPAPAPMCITARCGNFCVTTLSTRKVFSPPPLNLSNAANMAALSAAH